MQMNKTLSAVLIFVVSISAGAQSYNVALIPDSLKEDAFVVKRIDENIYDIKDRSSATYKYKLAYTILNSKGDDFSQSSAYYDKFRKIDDIKATLYDAEGNKIKTLKNSDIKDVSGQGGGTEISDDRVKSFGFYHRVYPYTVEFEVTLTFKGPMFLPSQYFISSENMGVQQSSISVMFPADAPVRYKSFLYPGNPVETQQGNKKVLSWELKNLKPVVREAAAPPWYELTPAVFFAMENFEIGGYAGSYTSWEKFGDFVYTLKRDRDELPTELKDKVHAIADQLPTKREKVEALYAYMQSNTRYISVQLGIGGWQPFDAKYVYDRKYGDCKALSNFMYALLKEAGIYSDYALIQAGAGTVKFIEDFPSSQFNHAILSVPLNKDTLWLECTSQTNAAGYLSDFTSDRYALLVKEKGSTLVRTPAYTALDNKQVRHTQVALQENGSMLVKMRGVNTGLQHDDLQQMKYVLNEAQIKEQLQRELQLGTYTIKEYSLSEIRKAIPEMEVQMVLESTGYAQRTGKRIFMLPNLFTKIDWRPKTDTARQYELMVSMSYLDIDTVVISMPAGFKPETIPAEKTLSTRFGTYKASAAVKEDKLYYYRYMSTNKGRFPNDSYGEYAAWYNDIYKADRYKLVLVQE